jgi:hypothetical protein
MTAIAVGHPRNFTFIVTNFIVGGNLEISKVRIIPVDSCLGLIYLLFTSI